MLEWAAGALLLALVLPWLLPAARDHRGGAVRIVLALAVGLAVAAAGAETQAMGAPGRMLRLGAILALVCGLIGLLGTVLFDLILPPLRVDVPSLVRDVVQIAVATLAVLVCLRLAGIDVLPLHGGRILEIGWRSTRVVTKDGDTLGLSPAARGARRRAGADGGDSRSA